MGNKPKKFEFVHQTVSAGRRARAGHETTGEPPPDWLGGKTRRKDPDRASLDVDCPAIAAKSVKCIPAEDRGSEAEGEKLSEDRNFATIPIVAASYCSSRSLTDR